ncbi:uncharacterized protein LOC130675634 [Microplitis mediator]|uniref:uncharacterized protein LOC130675634 n=1 Tax=Microplitis mediator TaxID=375433 RepID=UPI002552BF5C|nr:uncharacterized protein LOC130675634 [Microplitis mediator]
MKTFVILFVCAFVVCLWAEAHADCGGMGGDDKTYKTGDKRIDRCSEFTCQENGSWTSLGCGVWACEDQIGYQDYDYSKPYPECCPRPICASDKN